MNKYFSALAVWAMGMSGAAHAAIDYSAQFVLGTPPALAVGMDQWDASRSLVGSWESLNQRDISTSLRSLQGVDPGTGAAIWSDERTGSAVHTYSGLPLGMGEGISNLWEGGIRSNAEIDTTRLGTGVSFANDFGQAKSYARWFRDFQLDPHASVTLSGLAQLTVNDAVLPLTLETPFALQNNGAFASLSFQDVADRAGIRIGAELNAGQADFSDAYHYSVSTDGHLSLTLTNPSDQAVHGSFYAQSWSNAFASPAPEPSTGLTLLLGLGLICFVARKKPRSILALVSAQTAA